jgi:DNA polymerase-3 subunit delta'
MLFDSIAGHARVRRVLAGLLSAGRLPPSLLLAGPDGVGKRTVALEVARALVCDTGVGCGQCSACRRVIHGLAGLHDLRRRATAEESHALFNHRLHPDLILAEPSPPGALDGSRVTEILERPRLQWSLKVEQLRDLVAEVAQRPFEARARAIVIDDAHRMTTEGFNCLLKSLEEPPPDTHFILVTSSAEALAPTIRSRCQLLRFGPLAQEEVLAFLVEHRGFSREEASLPASLAGGSLAQALLFESDSYKALRADLIAQLTALPGSSVPERLAVAERVVDTGDVGLALTVLRLLLRDVAVIHAGGAGGRVLNEDVRPLLEAVARGPLGARARELAERTGEAREAVTFNANPRVTLDVLVDAFA